MGQLVLIYECAVYAIAVAQTRPLPLGGISLKGRRPASDYTPLDPVGHLHATHCEPGVMRYSVAPERGMILGPRRRQASRVASPITGPPINHTRSRLY